MAMMPILDRALQLSKSICVVGMLLLCSITIMETTHPRHGHFTSNNVYGEGFSLFDPFRLMMFPLFLYACQLKFIDHHFRRHPSSVRRDRVRMRMTLGAHRRLGYLCLLNKYPEIYKGQASAKPSEACRSRKLLIFRFIRPICLQPAEPLHGRDVVPRTSERIAGKSADCTSVEKPSKGRNSSQKEGRRGALGEPGRAALEGSR